MGTDRNGDGTPPDGERPPEQPTDDFPDLPGLPEDVRIPDDAADLADEAEQVRAELYRGSPQPPLPPRSGPRPGYGGAPSFAPVVVLCVAIVITLVSVLALILSGPGRRPDPSPAPDALPDVALRDASGRSVPLSALAPAAILLVERCRCDDLVVETAAAAPPGVTVVVVDRSVRQAPPDLPAGARVRLLADPEGELRSELGLGAPPADAATVVLADRNGLAQVNPAAGSVEPFLASLTELG